MTKPPSTSSSCADLKCLFSGNDFVDVSETLTFSPGDVGKTLTITIVTDDICENAETFSVRLRSTDPNVQVGGVNPTNVTITDDDSKCSTAVDRHLLQDLLFLLCTSRYIFCTAVTHRVYYCTHTAIFGRFHILKLSCDSHVMSLEWSCDSHVMSLEWSYDSHLMSLEWSYDSHLMSLGLVGMTM